MLTIRLNRMGKKREPNYRFVISEKARDPRAPALEILGFYNPRTQPATVRVNAERIKFWLEKGAQMSDTVRNLLIEQKLVEGAKARVARPKKAKAEEPAAPASVTKPAETKAEEVKPAAETPKEPAAEEKPADAEKKAE